MRRFSLILGGGNIVALALAIFVNFGMGLVIVALFHLLLSSVVIKPRIGELLLGRPVSQTTMEKLMKVGYSFHYRLYWIWSNLFYLGISIFLMFHSFKVINLLKR